MKKDTPPHYQVVIHGTYYAKTGPQKTIREYKETIPVPVMVEAEVFTRHLDPETYEYKTISKMENLHINNFGVLSTILKTKRLQSRLKAKDPAFYLIRTHEITDIIPSTPTLKLPSNPYLLNLKALKDYIKSNTIPIDTYLFPTLGQLREALVNYNDDPVAYKEYENRFRRRNSVQSAISSAIDDLEQLYTPEALSATQSFPEVNSAITDDNGL